MFRLLLPYLPFWALLSLVLALSACGSSQDALDTPVVPILDINQYQGKWYEIARLPHSFEEDLVNVTAIYTLKENGKLDVLNRGYRENIRGKLVEVRGRAWRPDPEQQGRLIVSFFTPFKSDYLVVALDEKQYQYAMVTNSKRSVLWILGRDPVMEETTYQQLLAQAEALGIFLDQLIKVEQNWE